MMIPRQTNRYEIHSQPHRISKAMSLSMLKTARARIWKRSYRIL